MDAVISSLLASHLARELGWLMCSASSQPVLPAVCSIAILSHILGASPPGLCGA